jgi:hypothetical protein
LPPLYSPKIFHIEFDELREGARGIANGGENLKAMPVDKLIGLRNHALSSNISRSCLSISH